MGGFFVNTGGGDWNLNVGGDIIKGNCIKVNTTEESEEDVVIVDADLIDDEDDGDDWVLGKVINPNK